MIPYTKFESPFCCASLVISAPRYPSPQFTLAGCPIESILSKSLDPLLRILIYLWLSSKLCSSILALSCSPVATSLCLLTSCSRNSFFSYTATSSSYITSSSSFCFWAKSSSPWLRSLSLLSSTWYFPSSVSSSESEDSQDPSLRAPNATRFFNYQTTAMEHISPSLISDIHAVYVQHLYTQGT